MPRKKDEPLSRAKKGVSVEESSSVMEEIPQVETWTTPAREMTEDVGCGNLDNAGKRDDGGDWTTPAGGGGDLDNAGKKMTLGQSGVQYPKPRRLFRA